MYSSIEYSRRCINIEYVIFKNPIHATNIFVYTYLSYTYLDSLINQTPLKNINVKDTHW